MISRFIKYRNKKLIKKYSREMPVQFRMRFKGQKLFSREQVSKILRITQLGTGLLKNVKKEKFAYAMFCSESDFNDLLPQLDYMELRQEIIGALFLNINKKTLSFSCLLNSAEGINSKYLSSLDPSSSYGDTGFSGTSDGGGD
jgi:hypothetical protein